MAGRHPSEREERNLVDAIIGAYIDCQPYPKELQIGHELLSELLRQAHFNDLEFDQSGVTKFSGVKIKLRRYLKGWQVVPLKPGDDEFWYNDNPDGKAIKSEDFDEVEALRLEERRSNGRA